MKEEKRNTSEIITWTDLTHKSCKSWQTIRKLFKDPTHTHHQSLVNTNQFISFSSMVEEQCQQSQSVLYYELLNASLHCCQYSASKDLRLRVFVVVVVCPLQPSSSVNSGCPGPESSILVSSRWACPISSQVTDH